MADEGRIQRRALDDRKSVVDRVPIESSGERTGYDSFVVVSGSTVAVEMGEARGLLNSPPFQQYVLLLRDIGKNSNQ